MLTWTFVVWYVEDLGSMCFHLLITGMSSVLFQALGRTLFILFIYFGFWDRFSLCSPGCPGTHSVENLPASGSQVCHHCPAFSISLDKSYTNNTRRIAGPGNQYLVRDHVGMVDPGLDLALLLDPTSCYSHVDPLNTLKPGDFSFSITFVESTQVFSFPYQSPGTWD